MIEYPITPCPKPRMTQSDKWKGRDIVVRYFNFRDEVRLRKVAVPESGAHIIFVMPMPLSWTIKKRLAMDGQPHQQVPDKDNLEKGLLDAVFTQDCRVWDSRVTKIWGYDGKIIVKEV